MKKFFVSFVIMMLSAAAYAADNIHLISVNGIAERSVDPNMVVVNMESWAKAGSAKKAQEMQAAQYAKLKTNLDKLNLSKDDIQTQSYNVYPEYFYDQKTQSSKISGYRVSHSIVVVYRKVESAGDFLDKIVTSVGETSGVNVNGISWDYDKKAQVETLALADAVKSARERANELAKAAGVTIKATHRIQNNSYTAPVYQEMVRSKSVMMADSSIQPTELSGGKIKVRVEVQMDFEI